ncbi:hypothetical protein AbraIFM66951_004182 [Aspergillus brasiliensis]|uniref:Amidohydrolase-related domain-containing protein n=1 Tax=Aspergillus brasiliensis TaxID=319629 RepID=A0A9W6DLY9_9EURO|nr:hypothetical protein AbraCBS73388_005586 [Aspergillus brasiliensis]GKZ50815.1 hypothetical protein AbraIFM66951_004182 [Aspergillus brasiliensis]
MSANPKITALTNVRIFDGNRILDPSTVIIDGEVIGSADATPTETIDANGAVLLPGLIDAHIHLLGPENLAQLADHGVTTAFDMATWPLELLTSLRNHPGVVTNILACGIPATAPGSIHSCMPTLPAEALLSTAADGEKFVTDRIAEGADYIKVVADVPGPTQETVDAIVRTAHQYGKKVIAHAVTTVATAMAQAAEVDVITHVAMDRQFNEEEITDMVRNHRISVPTLVMMKRVAERRGAKYDIARQNVAALHRAGVPILAGTDANTAPGSPATVAHGVTLHEELELLVDCGLSPVEVLRAATSLPARYFGLTDRGVVAPGYRADLVLVRGDPTQDIGVTRNIEGIWIGGERRVKGESSWI